MEIPKPHVRLADFVRLAGEAPVQSTADGAIRMLADCMKRTEAMHKVFIKEDQMHVPCFSNWNTVAEFESVYYYVFMKHIVFVKDCGCIFIYEKPKKIRVLSFLWYKKHSENLFFQKPSQSTKDLWEGTPKIGKMKLVPG